MLVFGRDRGRHEHQWDGLTARSTWPQMKNPTHVMAERLGQEHEVDLVDYNAIEPLHRKQCVNDGYKFSGYTLLW